MHLPFCAAKCSYCDFYSVPAEGQDLSGVLDDVLLEARRRAPRNPRTVFLGGGTPSLYSREELRRLLDGLDAITGFRTSAVEVTAECNPESLDGAKAETFLELGVDRLSVGVQSLRPNVLEFFGRVHTADQGLRALRAARSAGVQRLSADLIYSSPGLSSEQWREDLQAVLEVGLDHFSAYSLTFEEGTPLFRWRAQGKVREEPEEQQLEQFHATREIGAEHGFEAYEISNFAQAGERCSHNLAYWANAPYCGIGPSAVSKLGQTRFGSPKSIGKWRAAISADEPAAEWDETPDELARLGETWWLGLRTADGVDPRQALKTAGAGQAGEAAAASTALVLCEQGLLEPSGDGRYRLTVAGLPLADGVARKFLTLG